MGTSCKHYTGRRAGGVGGAAHLAQPGDRIIVATFTSLDDAAARAHRPRIVHVDDRNQPFSDASQKRCGEDASTKRR